MMESMRWFAGLLLLVLLAFCGLYVAAGRSAPPRLTIAKPDRFVGQASSLDVTAEAPDARLTALTIRGEQNGRTIPLFSLEPAAARTGGSGGVPEGVGAMGATVTQLDRNRLRVARPLGKRSVPELQ